MAAIGGSIERASIGGRNFAVPADTAATRKLGGSSNEVEPNGDTTARLIKTAMSWNVDGLEVSIDDARGDHEYLQDLANGNDFFAVAITLASGITYQGNGQVVGEIEYDTQAAKATVNLKGIGVLSQQ